MYRVSVGGFTGDDSLLPGDGVREGRRAVVVHKESEGRTTDGSRSKTLRPTTRLSALLYPRQRHRSQVCVFVVIQPASVCFSSCVNMCMRVCCGHCIALFTCGFIVLLPVNRKIKFLIL